MIGIVVCFKNKPVHVYITATDGKMTNEQKEKLCRDSVSKYVETLNTGREFYTAYTITVSSIFI
jgi:biotin synthase-like enzyme